MPDTLEEIDVWMKAVKSLVEAGKVGLQDEQPACSIVTGETHRIVGVCTSYAPKGPQDSSNLCCTTGII